MKTEDKNKGRDKLGRFAPDRAPRNKGTHRSSRKSFVMKGHQGFITRPVIEVAQDGSVKRKYKSVGECVRVLGIKDRHNVSHAIKRGWLCAGRKLIYADEFVGWADYSWRPRRGRDERGRLVKGHKLSSVYKRRPLTPEERERRRLTARKMVEDPGCKFGKVNRTVPVVCVTTGERFGSVTDAGKRYGIPQGYISLALARRGTTKGLKFDYLK